MPSVTKRGKTYQYIVSRYTDGKYDPIRKGGFKTKPEAYAAAIEVEAKIKKGHAVIVKNMPFIEYFKTWIETYKSNKHRDTKSRYYDSLSIVKKHFKDMPIQKITRIEYQGMINEYAKGHSRETVRKLNTHVRACVRDAIGDGYIQYDFTAKAEIHGTVAPKKDEDKYLEYEEAQLLYVELLNIVEKTKVHYLLILGLVTGLRYGELVGLTKKDFNFNEHTLNINKTWDYKKGTGFGNTKDDSDRIIPVDKNVMSLFKKWFKNLPDNENGLIFYSAQAKHKVITNAAVNKQLGKILAEIKINRITAHALRHTHASILLLIKKASVYYVSERLGHADIQTTLNTYTHVLSKLRVEEDRLIENIFDV